MAAGGGVEGYAGLSAMSIYTAKRVITDAEFDAQKAKLLGM